eukprot:Nk52_evm65s352 gene=Nk52_evmTU65s352
MDQGLSDSLLVGKGIGLALLAALLNGFADFGRVLLGKHFTYASQLVYVRGIFNVPALLFLAYLRGEIQPPDRIFLVAVLFSGVVNYITSLLYLTALQVAPLSLTVPYLSFTPVFLLFAGTIILNEYPTVQGTIGVLIVCFGAYILGISSDNRKELSVDNSSMDNGDDLLGRISRVLSSAAVNLLSVWNVKGSRYCLIVAALWSISASLDKLGTIHGSALFYSFFIHSCITIPAFVQFHCRDSPMVRGSTRKLSDIEAYRIGPLSVYRNAYALNAPLNEEHSSSEEASKLARKISPLVLILVNVAVGLAGLLCQLQASIFINVSYVIAIKRAGMIFPVILGRVFFKERRFKERLFSCFIMVCGVLCIVLQ